MKVIGITGGIGSGKSIVSQLLEINGIPVYNTDIASKKLSNTSPAIREKLTGKFGAELYEYGILNRKMLASLIFNDSEARDFVNSVIHPAVQNDFLEWKEEHRDKPFAGIESAILFQSKLKDLIDITINVSAPLELQIQRVQKRDNLNKEDILNRIHTQMSDEERSRLANYTVVNDDRQALLPQVENLPDTLKFQ
jgi:dephospho-CoA kinase